MEENKKNNVSNTIVDLLKQEKSKLDELSKFDLNLKYQVMRGKLKHLVLDGDGQYGKQVTPRTVRLAVKELEQELGVILKLDFVFDTYLHEDGTEHSYIIDYIGEDVIFNEKLDMTSTIKKTASMPYRASGVLKITLEDISNPAAEPITQEMEFSGNNVDARYLMSSIRTYFGRTGTLDFFGIATGEADPEFEKAEKAEQDNTKKVITAKWLAILEDENQDAKNIKMRNFLATKFRITEEDSLKMFIGKETTTKLTKIDKDMEALK